METPAAHHGRARFRIALAGTFGAIALAAGAGAAYAASTSTGSEVVETGYATVVETDGYDCPDTSGDGSADPAVAR